jgi:antitoxin VapB
MKIGYYNILKRICSMPLYIKDPEVDRLTQELISITKSSKVDAVKDALKHEIARRRAALPLRDRLAKSLAMAREAGPFAPGDHKRETDEMWGED